MLEDHMLVSRQKGEESEEDQGLTKVLFKEWSEVGQVGVESMASMSWRKRLSELSCVPSRHHHYEDRRNDSRMIKSKRKFQVEPYRRDHVLEACHPFSNHGCVKMCLKRVSPIVEYGGAIRKTSPSKRNQERRSILRRSRSSSSSSSGLRKAKVCSW